MTKTHSERKAALIADTIASIQNEELQFNMNYFVKPGCGLSGYRVSSDKDIPDCNTASCMAGHMEAVRPELAKEALQVLTDPQHDDVAGYIWCRETGESFCPIDFYAKNHPYRYNTNDDIGIDLILGAEAIAHLRGENEEWPQLTRVQCYDFAIDDDDGEEPDHHEDDQGDY